MSRAKHVELPPVDGPCEVCAGPHDLRGCDTEEAVRLLEERGQIMSAENVRERMRVRK